MIYRMSIYYYRYSLFWLRWEKCRSPIPLANLVPPHSLMVWHAAQPSVLHEHQDDMHWTLGTAALRRARFTSFFLASSFFL